jgi:hypothetical protein
MAFLIRPDRADDSSAPISSAFREFSIFSLPDFLSSRLFTFPLGSLWGQRAPTQNSEEPKIQTLKCAETVFLFQSLLGTSLRCYGCFLRDSRAWVLAVIILTLERSNPFNLSQFRDPNANFGFIGTFFGTV